VGRDRRRGRRRDMPGSSQEDAFASVLGAFPIARGAASGRSRGVQKGRLFADRIKPRQGVLAHELRILELFDSGTKCTDYVEIANGLATFFQTFRIFQGILCTGKCAHRPSGPSAPTPACDDGRAQRRSAGRTARAREYWSRPLLQRFRDRRGSKHARASLASRRSSSTRCRASGLGRRRADSWRLPR